MNTDEQKESKLIIFNKSNLNFFILMSIDVYGKMALLTWAPIQIKLDFHMLQTTCIWHGKKREKKIKKIWRARKFNEFSIGTKLNMLK